MKRVPLLFFILFFGLVGCTGHDIDDSDIEEATDDRPTGLLPIVSYPQACIDPDEAAEDHTRPETFEDWVSGASDVVIGTVADIQPVFVPYRVTNAVPTEVAWEEEECSELFPAVDIYLTDVDSLLGSDLEEVRFRVSSYLISDWESGVVDDGEGQYWIESNSDPELGIAPGMRIGTRLYESELLSEVLTPAMTLLFEVDEEEEIYFQSPKSGFHYACAGYVDYFNRPEDPVRDGISVAQLREGIGGLEVDDVAPEDSTRPYIRKIWDAGDAQHLIFVGAARCMDFDSERPVCLSELDCEPGMTCVDGLCS